MYFQHHNKELFFVHLNTSLIFGKFLPELNFDQLLFPSHCHPDMGTIQYCICDICTFFYMQSHFHWLAEFKFALKLFKQSKGSKGKQFSCNEGSKIFGLFYMQSYFHWLELFKETKIQNKNRLAAVKEARYLDFFTYCHIFTDLDYKCRLVLEVNWAIV